MRCVLGDTCVAKGETLGTNRSATLGGGSPIDSIAMRHLASIVCGFTLAKSRSERTRMNTLFVASFTTLLLLSGCSSTLGDTPPDDLVADAASTSGDPPSTTPDPGCDPDDDVCVPNQPDPESDPVPDPDPNSDPEPSEIEVPLFIVGDCVTAACPAEAPYPVGCNVIFSPGDDRGCVASQPDTSVVYFQAGDKCDQGLILGTLFCSVSAGPALSLATCPINKPVPMHVAAASMCPETN